MVLHLVLEKVVIVVDVVEQVMMEQGQGRLAGIVLSSSWLPSPSPCLLHNPCARPPLSILCTCTLPTMMLCPPCPGGTIWVKATRCFSHQSFAKTFTNAMHQCSHCTSTNGIIATYFEVRDNNDSSLLVSLEEPRRRQSRWKSTKNLKPSQCQS